MITCSRVTAFLVIAVLVLLAAGCTGGKTISPPQEPLDPRVETLYGKAYVLWGREDRCSDPERAIALLNSALDIAPEHAPSLVRRGLAYAQLGYFEDAFNDITRAITLSPTAENYAWRAAVLLREGNEKAAQSDLDFAFRLDNNCRQAWNTQGLLHLAQGDDEKACKAFRNASNAGDATWLIRARKENICR